MIAYAIIKKNNKINTYEIYPDTKDVILDNDEKWVKVEIKILR